MNKRGNQIELYKMILALGFYSKNYQNPKQTNISMDIW